MIKNFVSLDFETANAKYPCSIGLVKFENGSIVNKYYSLINPEIEKFNVISQRIHGISKEDVINEKTFPEVWLEIEEYFENKVIVAHNMGFDYSILKFMLESYSIDIPTFRAYCTYNLSRQFLNIERYKLSSVAKFLGITQKQYHNSLDDAIVCGNVFLRLFENGLKLEDEYLFEQNTNSRSSKGYFNYNNWKQNQINNNRERDETYFKNLLNKSSESFCGKTFVVSGVFQKVSRNEVKILIENNGGKVTGSVSSKTSFVIAGDNMGPSKKEKAESLGIPIISEDEFLGMV